MKATKLFALLLAAMLLLSACGASSAPSKNTMAMDMMAAPMADAPAAEEAYMETQPNSLTSTESGSAAIPDNRKWIITMNMTVETEDLDAMLQQLDQHILALQGYVEGQNVQNGSAYSSRRYRSANLTVRIPAEAVDQFTQQVEGICNVVSSNKNLEDITLTYVSTESRMKALQTEEARLLELMAQAETMSDLLEIESRLTDVRYELENVTSQLRTYDNQVNFATVYLYIEEVQVYTPVAERTVGQRIREDFAANLKDLGEDAVDFFVWVLVSSPYLVVYALIIALAVLAWKKLPKKAKIRKEKKKKDAAPPAQEENP